jgi:hypothetical protein
MGKENSLESLPDFQLKSLWHSSPKRSRFVKVSLFLDPHPYGYLECC